MPGRDGPLTEQAPFVFETHHPSNEKARLFESLRAYAAAHRWDRSVANEIELILEEWVSDVISYGIDGNPAPFLRVEITTGGHRARLTITDNGVPFDPTGLPAPDLSVPAEQRPIGGLGIFMMKKLSSAMSYRREPSQNILIIEKDLTAPSLGRKN